MPEKMTIPSSPHSKATPQNPATTTGSKMPVPEADTDVSSSPIAPRSTADIVSAHSAPPTSSSSIAEEKRLVDLEPLSADNPTPEPKKKKTTTVIARKLTRRRKGARVDEDEGEREVSALESREAELTEVSSDELSPHSEDEDDDDDEGPTDSEPETEAKTPLINNSSVEPVSWSDQPREGEQGSNDLPPLDFATLKLDSSTESNTALVVPTHGAVNPIQRSTPSLVTTGAEKAQKKAAFLAKRVAKSEELKAKDPVAWEAQEAEWKAKEEIKRRDKKEKVKEKRKERKPYLHQQAVVTEKEASSATTLANDSPSNAAPSRQSSSSLPSTRSSVQHSLGRPEVSPNLKMKTAGLSTSISTSPSSPNLQQSPEYVHAREAYSSRLAADPSYVPRVGKFWSHDDRLAEPEVRSLNPFWRGRGRGGEMNGGMINGRGRGRGRGGFSVSNGRRSPAGNGFDHPREDLIKPLVQSSLGKKNVEDKQIGGKGVEEKEPRTSKTVADEDSEDDGWGRGEAKRSVRSSINPNYSPLPAAVPSWSHDGFDELKQQKETRPNSLRGREGFAVRGAHGRVRGGAGGAGGTGAGAGVGGAVVAAARESAVSASAAPTPGAINSRYAHLPYHPLHRYPGMIPENVPLDGNVKGKKDVRNNITKIDPVLTRPEDSLFAPTEQQVVRLPGSSSSSSGATSKSKVQGTAATIAVKLPGAGQKNSESQQAERSGSENLPPLSMTAPAAESNFESAMGTIVAAAVHPTVTAPAVKKVELATTTAPLPLLQQGFVHHSPAYVHPAPVQIAMVPSLSLQSQSQRYGSPVYQSNRFYTPDPYTGTMTPPLDGSTPPPSAYLVGQQHVNNPALFVPPRVSKVVEIKAPPSGGIGGHKSVLSASGDAFSPSARGREDSAASAAAAAQTYKDHQAIEHQYRIDYQRQEAAYGYRQSQQQQQQHEQQQRQQQQLQQQHQQLHLYPSNLSYSRDRRGRPVSPSNPMYGAQSAYGNGGGSSDGDYVPVESNGIVYFVKASHLTQGYYQPGLSNYPSDLHRTTQQQQAEARGGLPGNSEALPLGYYDNGGEGDNQALPPYPQQQLQQQQHHHHHHQQQHTAVAPTPIPSMYEYNSAAHGVVDGHGWSSLPQPLVSPLPPPPLLSSHYGGGAEERY